MCKKWLINFSEGHDMRNATLDTGTNSNSVLICPCVSSKKLKKFNLILQSKFISSSLKHPG